MDQCGSEFSDRNLVVEWGPHSPKREYSSPRLNCLGSVRELTQAASRSSDTENRNGSPFWKQRP